MRSDSSRKKTPSEHRFHPMQVDWSGDAKRQTDLTQVPWGAEHHSAGGAEFPDRSFRYRTAILVVPLMGSRPSARTTPTAASAPAAASASP